MVWRGAGHGVRRLAELCEKVGSLPINIIGSLTKNEEIYVKPLMLDNRGFAFYSIMQV